MLQTAHAESHGSGRGKQRKTPGKSGTSQSKRKGSGEIRERRMGMGIPGWESTGFVVHVQKFPQEFRDKARLPCPTWLQAREEFSRGSQSRPDPKNPFSSAWTESHSCKTRDIPRMLPGFSHGMLAALIFLLLPSRFSTGAGPSEFQEMLLPAGCPEEFGNLG